MQSTHSNKDHSIISDKTFIAKKTPYQYCYKITLFQITDHCFNGDSKNIIITHNI